MRAAAFITAGLTMSCLAVSANAQSASSAATVSPKGAVEVRVGAVLASNRGEGIDRRLASMRRQFNSFFSYTSYRLVEEQRKRIAWGKKAGFDVPGGRYVMVSPRTVRRDRIVMKVVVVDGTQPVVDTLVGLRDRGTFLVGGQRQADGLLILAISADRVR